MIFRKFIVTSVSGAIFLDFDGSNSWLSEHLARQLNVMQFKTGNKWASSHYFDH